MSVARALVVPPQRRWVWGRGVLLVGIVLLGLAGRALAQQGRMAAPGEAYQMAFTPFYDGDYNRALKIFQDQWRGAIKNVQSRWIDSICYHTMMGECFYHMGLLDQALEQYTDAVRLSLAFPDWMLQVRFDAALRPDLNAAVHQVPWGHSSRQVPAAAFARYMSIMQGVIDNEPAVRQGGVVQQAMLMPVNVVEIVRCTALAIRRRTELLGPLASYDPLSNDLVAELSRRPAPPNHWSQCWIDVELGLALLGTGKTDDAVPLLRRSLAAGGQFDHPLTGMALSELARLSLLHGDYAEAIKQYEEASYSAAYFGDYGIVEESLRGAALAHLLSNQGGVYAPLVPAAQWGRAKGWRQLHVSMLLSGVEELLLAHQDREAATALEEAREAIGRRDIGMGDQGARLHYLQAQSAFQQHKVAVGLEALAGAMSYLQHGSLWLFHIQLLDQHFASGQMNARGSITPRAAMELYGQLLRDPQPQDWSLMPMDALAVLMTPHREAFEHWFLVAMERKETETAVEIADRARRHRFLSSLPLGGRAESLRWILEAPEAALSRTALQQRQNLLAENAEYGPLSQQAQQIRRDLKALPLVAADNEAQRKQSEGLAKLEQLGQQQEAILHEMVLRRQPAEIAFPPLRTTREIQAGLPPGTALLDFFVAGNEYYGFLLNNSKYGAWRIRGTNALPKRLMALLRDFGQYDANRPLPSKELGEVAWKEAGKKFLDSLLEGSLADLSQSFPELVIVPDGLLWYLPFEALEIKQGDALVPLISRVRIRYAPTASLAISDGRQREARQTLVVLGRLSPKHDDGTSKAFEVFSKAVPDSVALPGPTVPAPANAYAALVDRLVVLDDLGAAEANPYGWSPFSLDHGKPGSTLADWFALPWNGPAVVVLPGFHTAAESGLKHVEHKAPGNGLFLSVCGLMANGAQTILLSRWRTGGQSSFDLVREFVQELPNSTPAEAWQRSVLLAASTPLDLAAEPRITPSTSEEVPKAIHPFFWSGFLLVDSGPYVKPEEAVAVPGMLPKGAAAPAGDAAEPPPQAQEPAAAEAPAAGEDNAKESKARPSRTKKPAKAPPKNASRTKGTKAEP